MREELQKPGVREAMDDVRRGAAQEPDEPDEPEEEAGREAAAEEKPAEASDEGEDYDPEELAEYPEDEPEEGEPAKPAVAAKTEPPPETTPTAKPPEGWTDEDQQLWREFKESRKAPAEEEPPAPPTPEQYRKIFEDTLHEMVEQDQTLGRAWAGINARREEITQADKTIADSRSELAGLDETVRSKRAIVAHYEEMAKADPEDEAVALRLGRLRSELQDARADHNEKSLALQRLESQTNSQKIEYQQAIEQLGGIVKGEINSRAQRLQHERDAQTSGAAARREFDEHLPSVLKELGIPEEHQARVERLLRPMVAAEEDVSQLSANNLRGWMKKMVEADIAPLFQGARQTEARKHIEAKVKDADQPAPDPSRATAPPRKSKAPLGFREADRIAEREMRQALKPRSVAR
jgi:hypothetical protein